MARIPRLLLRGESATYHVMSRSTLPGFTLSDREKEAFLALLKRLVSVYFVELLGFCILGNHFHLLVRMHLPEEFSDEEVKRRFGIYYEKNPKKVLLDAQIPLLREKWASLSEFAKDLKQTFTRLYNKEHGHEGCFWGQRFKSVLVDSGDTLINVLAYIDLNPVRAAIVKKPEDYRWSSIGYHVQTGNAGGLLSLDFGLAPFTNKPAAERFDYYRRFLYEIGSVATGHGASIPEEVYQREAKAGFKIGGLNRLLYRTRYFTDSGVIGTKEFVARCSALFHDHFACRHEKRPKPISGLDGVYSLKRLTKKPV